MTSELHALAFTSMHAITFAQGTSQRASYISMKTGWFERLIKTIHADKRGMRELSRLAGTGPNYVQQMIKDRKEPGADRLARLLDVLGTENALFILTGVHASPDDLELLRLLQMIPDHLKTQIVPLLTAMQSPE